MLSNRLILVAEDDALLAAVLRSNLETQGFQVEEAADGKKALARIAETKPDLVLLDWVLPGMSGIDVCRQIRRSAAYSVAIIIVGARSGDQDIVDALNAGADTYITKPFNMGLLLARVGALFRRADTLWPERLIVFLDVTMDLAAHCVQRNDRRVHLGPTEFRMLKVLLEQPHHVFSRRSCGTLCGDQMLPSNRAQ
jgi:two-component system, OmpR family, phosphate regulon response regulator PhoB